MLGHCNKQDCPKHPVCVHYIPWNQDTSLIRTLTSVPRVSRLEMFHKYLHNIFFSSQWQEGRGGEGKTVVVSLSPQARASIAAKFNLTAQEVYTRIRLHSYILQRVHSICTVHGTTFHMHCARECTINALCTGVHSTCSAHNSALYMHFAQRCTLCTAHSSALPTYTVVYFELSQYIELPRQLSWLKHLCRSPEMSWTVWYVLYMYIYCMALFFRLERSWCHFSRK